MILMGKIQEILPGRLFGCVPTFWPEIQPLLLQGSWKGVSSAGTGIASDYQTPQNWKETKFMKATHRKATHRIPRRRIATIVAALLLAWTAPMLALQEPGQQEPQEQSPPAQQSQQSSQVDEAKLDAVAKAYVEVAEIQNTYAPRIESARSAEEKQQLEQEAMQEMAQAIEDQEGVDVEEYNLIMTAAQTDDQLLEQLTAKVHKIQQEKQNNQATDE
jgi:hypothetical protein